MDKLFVLGFRLPELGLRLFPEVAKYALGVGAIEHVINGVEEWVLFSIGVEAANVVKVHRSGAFFK